MKICIFWIVYIHLEPKVVNYEQKEITPLTDDENRYYKELKECYLCPKAFFYNKNKKKKFKFY